jgi:hypothetical protein
MVVWWYIYGNIIYADDYVICLATHGDIWRHMATEWRHMATEWRHMATYGDIWRQSGDTCRHMMTAETTTI